MVLAFPQYQFDRRGERMERYLFFRSQRQRTGVCNTYLGYIPLYGPQFSPRLYCFLDAKLSIARQKAPEHPEYKSLIQRAGTALAIDYDKELKNLYASHDKLYQNVEYLYRAYLITRDDKYAQKLVNLLEAMIANPCSSSVLYSDNFITSTVTYAHASVYDLLAERLSPSLRRAAEAFVADQCRRFYRSSRGYEENHIFDNHFWQINYRLMFFSALTLYDRSEYPDALTLLEYLYELGQPAPRLRVSTATACGTMAPVTSLPTPRPLPIWQ